MFDTCSAKVHVAVVRFDVPCAALIGDTADRADERQVLRFGRDAEELTGLEIDRHLDREAGVPVEALVWCHQCKPY
jgi:hypothetical protein